MVSVIEIDGAYVSSSLPKVLMMPTSIRRKSLVKDPHKRDGSSSVYDNVLYYRAQKKSDIKLAKHETVREHHGGGGDQCPPVTGREHVPVQTDLYLEELCDMIEEADEACQTDPLLDRPSSPLFVPAKSGIDVETQIYPGELFDYDKEVQPLLESLVGQTLEQSLIEVAAEEELEELEEHQKTYESRREVELTEKLRLEEQERRVLLERQKRLEEQEEAVRLEEDATQKIAACIFAQNYLSDLLPTVYKRLEAQGYFTTQDQDVEEIEEHFWPWLIDEVSSEINTLEASCVILDSLIEEAVQNICDTAVILPLTPDRVESIVGDKVEETLSRVEELLTEEEKELEGEEMTDETPNDTSEMTADGS